MRSFLQMLKDCRLLRKYILLWAFLHSCLVLLVKSSLLSSSKVFIRCDVCTTDQKSFSSLGRFFFGTGRMHDVFQRVGTLPSCRLMLKTWLPKFSCPGLEETWGHTLSGPAAFWGQSFLSSPLTWSAVMQGGGSEGGCSAAMEGGGAAAGVGERWEMSGERWERENRVGGGCRHGGGVLPCWLGGDALGGRGELLSWSWLHLGVVGGSRVAEPIEEVVQVIGSLHTLSLCAGHCFVACDCSDSLPDAPLGGPLRLLLHFLPIGIFCHPQAAFHLLLCCFHLLLVFRPEGLFLFVEDSLDSLCYQWFIIWVTLNCLDGGNHV